MSIVKPPSLPLPSSMNAPTSILASPRDAVPNGMNGSLGGPLLKTQNTLASNGPLLTSHHPSNHSLPHPHYPTTTSHSQQYGSTSANGASSGNNMSPAQYYGQEPSYSNQYVGMEFGNPHMSQAQTPPPHTVTSNNTLGSNTMGGHLSYHPPQHLQPSYQPSGHNTYSSYQFTNPPGFTSPSHQTPVSNAGLSAHVGGPLVPLQRGPLGSSGTSLSSSTGAPSLLGNTMHQTGPYANAPFDTTGQIAPPGVKPRVTATLWEDEGSLCFQVEAKGVCVARREDNHMINGTKLLNVAGMTRGRRDGILKSEKVRHVVKIGPMHLKGVWIPFERALDFANKEKITECLYPLFVHNINALLYHPTNIPRTSAMVSAADRQRQNRDLQQHQPPQQQLQHRRPEGIVPSSQPLPSPGNIQHAPAMSHLPTQHTLPSHHGGHLARPNIERSTSFPTPPSSSSSMLGMGSSDQYWNGSSINPGAQAVPLDSGINSRSMPTTPVTTPPGSNLQHMQPYASGTYGDAYRPGQVPLPAQQSQNTSPSGMPRYSSQVASQRAVPYLSQGRNTSDMGPPLTSRHAPSTPSRPSSRQNNTETKDGAVDDHHPVSSEADDHEGNAEEEADPEAEHEDEYTHDNGQSYHGNRAPYYSSVGSLNGEHNGHITPDLVSAGPRGINGSRSPYGTPSLAVPRTVETPSSTNTRPPGATQSSWSSPSSFAMNPNATGTVGYDNVYQSVNGRERPVLAEQSDNAYHSQNGMNVPMSTSYTNTAPGMNTLSSGTKRSREDDDEHESRASNRAGDEKHISDDTMIKRRKTGGSSPLMNVMASGSFDRDNSNRLNRRSALVQRGRR